MMPADSSVLPVYIDVKYIYISISESECKAYYLCDKPNNDLSKVSTSKFPEPVTILFHGKMNFADGITVSDLK